MFEFEEGGRKKMLVFDVRHWISNREGEMGQPGKVLVGNIFYGSKGYMTRERFGYKTYLGREQQPGPAAGPSRENSMANFVEAVRSRRRQDLNAEIEEGAVTCTLIHLANISYRLGRTLRFDPQTLTCIGDAEANAMLRRKYRAPYVVPGKV